MWSHLSPQHTASIAFLKRNQWFSLTKQGTALQLTKVSDHFEAVGQGALAVKHCEETDTIMVCLAFRND